MEELNLQRSSTEELVARFISGDRSAFREIVDRTRGRVYNAVYSMVGLAGEADDIAQEVYIKIYSSLDRFNFQSKFETWLYRIAINTTIDYLRKQKRDRTVAFDDFSESERRSLEKQMTMEAPADDDNLEHSELQESIQKVLATLSPKYRQVIVLREIEGLKYDEIANVLGCSIGTVESRLHRARRELKKKLNVLMHKLERG